MTHAQLDVYSNVKIFNQIGDLAYFRKKLGDSNPGRYKYMSVEQKQAERTFLINAIFLLRMDAQEQMNRKRKAKLKACCDDIQACCDKLAQLDYIDDPLIVAAGREHPLGYLGLYAHLDSLHQPDYSQQKQVQQMVAEARKFTELIKALNDPMEDRLNTQRKVIAFVNENRRNHWIAGVSTMSAFIEYMTAEFDYRFKYQADLDTCVKSLHWPMGFLSVFLYIYRLFFLELGEAIQQAVSNWNPVQTPLVALEDKGALPRFYSDVTGLRKYIILNDILWCAVNLLTFVYLVGPLSSTLGFAGAVFTIASLVVDIILTIARYIELRNEYHKKLEALDDQDLKLRIKISEIERVLAVHALQNQGEERAALENQLIYLKKTNEEIKAAKVQLSIDWKYQKYALWNEMAYTVSIMCAFGVMCGFFIVGIAGFLTMSLVGACVWFCLTIVFAGANAAIEGAKINASIDQRREAAEGLIAKFNKPGLDENTKRQLYLNIKELLARNTHDVEYIRYLRKKTVIRTFMHLAFPIAIFSSLVFLPIVWAVPAIIAFVGLICLLNWQIKNWLEDIKPLKHDDKFFPNFDDTNKFGKKYADEFNELDAKAGALTLDDFENPVVKVPVIPKPDDGEPSLDNFEFAPA
ncbi:MAG: hypothetical protein A3F17_07790 [Gammaproteobacteria bacterium RIFCSPHIGHO2_12_FULL_41_15]|nr:MAG: hypothetical protein A3F17_07790 [Gammaproteobacteria bacterium RIFCSPHIGHO2_12_FULL_41_15]